MELKLGEWKCSWENGIIAGRTEVYLGERDYRWEN